MQRRAFLLGTAGSSILLLGAGRRVVSAAQHTAASAGTVRVAPKGKMTLAWHTGMASRWLDPQEHDGTATPDNFITALHDALIKNHRDRLFDQPGLAERFEFAPDAKQVTFWLRPGIKFHNGEPVTPEDVKFSFEHYRGAKADVLKGKTERIEIVDDLLSASTSRSPSWTSSFSMAPPTSAARPGLCPPGITSRSDRMALSRSPLALARTGWSARRPGHAWSLRPLASTTGRYISNGWR